MKTASLNNQVTYNDSKPAIEVLLETSFSKEIRILLKKDQLMKEHKAPYPIVIEIFEGEIDFTVSKEKLVLKKGDLITLEGNVPHSLHAVHNSIVRLSLSKKDALKRVEKVIQ